MVQNSKGPTQGRRHGTARGPQGAGGGEQLGAHTGPVVRDSWGPTQGPMEAGARRRGIMCSLSAAERTNET